MQHCVQIYTGDGKGKTSAALGLLLRAVGAGQGVFFCQFLKDGTSSECITLRERFPDVTCRYFGSGKLITGSPSPPDKAAAQAGFAELRAAVHGGAYDLVIADEINHAVKLKLIDVEAVIDLMTGKPPAVELVFTGRKVHPRIMEHADLVSEIVCRRHPFKRGLTARRGIDF